MRSAIWVWTFSLAGLLQAAELRVVPQLDLKQYAGKWYEVARLPNRFQRMCESNTTATYELRPDGKITVINACRKADGSTTTAKGTAKLLGGANPNSKLKVTFFWPFYGDYWVMDLDPDYRWAVVGGPDRKYLWILSRTPALPDDVYRGLVERATAQGYKLDALIRTRQTGK